MSITVEGPPVLESGDRLTRAEFHRRYCARPDIKKAELVMGVVYVGSPVRTREHGKPHGIMTGWLLAFTAQTPGLELSDNGTVFLDEDSEVQPDVCLFWASPDRGGASLTETGYLDGAPVLVAEIAASSASYDLHDKKEAYRRAGVPEYIAWRVIDQQIDWFHLQDGVYVRLEPNADGMIESRVLPGLHLSVAAMLAGDAAAVLAALGVRL